MTRLRRGSGSAPQVAQMDPAAASRPACAAAGPSLVIATSRAAYCRPCWAASELVLTCPASWPPQDRNVTFT